MAGARVTPTKRLFDIVWAVGLVAFLAIPFGILLAFLAITDGRPLFHVSERMRSPTRAFGLVKLRTMRVDPGDRGVSGGDKSARITPMGAWLRRKRLDEIPQLWNILAGDISFVGPRPPLREYVERYPALYADVLRSRPGITGLASIAFHAHEERLLAACRDAAETDAVYVRRCVPRKARIDLLYQRRPSVCHDWILMLRTIGNARRVR